MPVAHKIHVVPEELDRETFPCSDLYQETEDGGRSV